MCLPVPGKREGEAGAYHRSCERVDKHDASGKHTRCVRGLLSEPYVALHAAVDFHKSAGGILGIDIIYDDGGGKSRDIQFERLHAEIGGSPVVECQTYVQAGYDAGLHGHGVGREDYTSFGNNRKFTGLHTTAVERHAVFNALAAHAERHSQVVVLIRQAV